MTALERTVGRGTSHRFFRSRYPPTAPMRVARLPKITSTGMAPPSRFPRTQPTNRPGMAAGVNMGRMVNASEILTCISPKEMGAKITVSTTYRAAMIAPWATFSAGVRLFFMKSSSSYQRWRSQSAPVAIQRRSRWSPVYRLFPRFATVFSISTLFLGAAVFPCPFCRPGIVLFRRIWYNAPIAKLSAFAHIDT